VELTEELFKEITGVRLDAPVYEGAPDRRKHPRVCFGSRGKIFPLMEGAGGSGCTVLVRDISRGGVGFLFGEELAVGDEFILHLTKHAGGKIAIQCIVTRCELGGTGLVQFDIGATFELVLDESQWKAPKDAGCGVRGSMAGPELGSARELLLDPNVGNVDPRSKSGVLSRVFGKREGAEASQLQKRLQASEATVTAMPVVTVAQKTETLPAEAMKRAKSMLFLAAEAQEPMMPAAAVVAAPVKDTATLTSPATATVEAPVIAPAVEVVVAPAPVVAQPEAVVAPVESIESAMQLETQPVAVEEPIAAVVALPEVAKSEPVVVKAEPAPVVVMPEPVVAKIEPEPVVAKPEPVVAKVEPMVAKAEVAPAAVVVEKPIAAVAETPVARSKPSIFASKPAVAPVKVVAAPVIACSTTAMSMLSILAQPILAEQDARALPAGSTVAVMSTMAYVLQSSSMKSSSIVPSRVAKAHLIAGSAGVSHAKACLMRGRARRR